MTVRPGDGDERERAAWRATIEHIQRRATAHLGKHMTEVWGSLIGLEEVHAWHAPDNRERWENAAKALWLRKRSDARTTLFEALVAAGKEMCCGRFGRTVFGDCQQLWFDRESRLLDEIAISAAGFVWMAPVEGRAPRGFAEVRDFLAYAAMSFGYEAYRQMQDYCWGEGGEPLDVEEDEMRPKPALTVESPIDRRPVRIADLLRLLQGFRTRLQDVVREPRREWVVRHYDACLTVLRDDCGGNPNLRGAEIDICAYLEIYEYLRASYYAFERPHRVMDACCGRLGTLFSHTSRLRDLWRSFASTAVEPHLL